MNNFVLKCLRKQTIKDLKNMKIIQNYSFGSNCEMHGMLESYYGISESNIFRFTNITLESLCNIIKNNLLTDYSNIVYRLHCQGSDDTKITVLPVATSLEELRQFLINNPTNKTVHINPEYYLNNNLMFWTHGGNLSSDSVINSENLNLEIQSVKQKYEYLVSKTIDVLNNDDKLICIKCLKGEYTLELILKIQKLIMKNYKNTFLAIICENDESVSFPSLYNTFIFPCNVLTPHNEAVYYDKYGTRENYINFFQGIRHLLIK